jgi:hypothetical protein
MTNYERIVTEGTGALLVGFDNGDIVRVVLSPRREAGYGLGTEIGEDGGVSSYGSVRREKTVLGRIAKGEGEYVILKTPGAKAWGGRTSGWRYKPTQLDLLFRPRGAKSTSFSQVASADAGRHVKGIVEVFGKLTETPLTWFGGIEEEHAKRELDAADSRAKEEAKHAENTRLTHIGNRKCETWAALAAYVRSKAATDPEASSLTDRISDIPFLDGSLYIRP